MAEQNKKGAEPHNNLDDRVRRIEREILNAFTVARNTGLADGAGAPGSTAAGNDRAGMPDADKRRGDRD